MTTKDKFVRNIDEDKLKKVQDILGPGTTQGAAINYSLEQVARAASGRQSGVELLEWISEGGLPGLEDGIASKPNLAVSKAV